MNDNTFRKLHAFDALFTSDRIQILKLLVSYTTGNVHRMIILYIKILEMQIALRMQDVTTKNKTGTDFDLNTFTEEIIPFCQSSENASILEILHTLQSFQELKDTLEMFQTMQEMFTNDNTDTSELFSDMPMNVFDLMQSFLGKEPINDRKSETGMDAG